VTFERVLVLALQFSAFAGHRVNFSARLATPSRHVTVSEDDDNDDTSATITLQNSISL
jgi:hypothetical protein